MNFITSYCKYSGVKLASAAQFAGYKHLRGLNYLSVHPAFEAPAQNLLRSLPQVIETGSYAERKILLCALMHRAQLWKFTAPMPDVQKDALPVLLEFYAIELRVLNLDGSQSKQYPVLNISEETTKDSLFNHLKLVADILSARRSFEDEDKLDWEIELEADLNRTLQRGGRYNTKLGDWAVQSLKDCYIRNKIEAAQVEQVKYCLETVADRLQSNYLQQAIETLKDHLPCNDPFEREKGLMVIRFLESKLEQLQVELEDFGFAVVVETKGAGTKLQADSANYTIKSAVIKQSEVLVIKPEHYERAKQELIAEGKTTTSNLLVAIRAKTIAQQELQNS